jgi:hypothetical protein
LQRPGKIRRGEKKKKEKRIRKNPQTYPHDGSKTDVEQVLVTLPDPTL